MMVRIYRISVFCVLFFMSLLNGNKIIAQAGSSCASPVTLFPAITGDCSAASGPDLSGQYMCESGDCATVAMPGAGTGVDGTCTADNDATQQGTWLSFTATAGNITIQNETSYAGPGASNINKKDYVVFSGTCGSLTQIGCSADLADGSNFTVTGLTVGTTYYIWVTRSATSIAEGCPTCNSAATCLTSTVAFVPTNNNCSGATTLTTNSSFTSTNAAATDNGASDASTSAGAVCLSPASGSVENNVWYSWCADASWPVGQLAYFSVYSVVCNSTAGLQVGIYNAGQTCGTFSSSLICNNPGNVSNFNYSWVATAGQCYYINIDGFAGTACSYGVTAGSIVVLPIELVSFEAKVLGKNLISLTWNTSSETNNDYFTIERTVDGTTFEAIGVIDGAGNSTSLLNYASEDTKPYAGTSYYRLKQTDYDGNYGYSALRMVTVSDDFSDLNFSVVPNPADKSEGAKIKLVGIPNDIVVISMYDITGKIVEQNKVVLSSTGEASIETNRNIQSGMYFFNASTQSGQSINQKFIVK